jgi:hypothetical protein
MASPTIICAISKNTRESVRVALDQYRGMQLVDIRVTFEENMMQHAKAARTYSPRWSQATGLS